MGDTWRQADKRNSTARAMSIHKVDSQESPNGSEARASAPVQTKHPSEASVHAKKYRSACRNTLEILCKANVAVSGLPRLFSQSPPREKHHPLHHRKCRAFSNSVPASSFGGRFLLDSPSGRSLDGSASPVERPWLADAPDAPLEPSARHLH